MAQEGEKAFRLRSLEDTTMLAQRVERIRDGLIEKGVKKGERRGLKKGERRGLKKGKRAGLREGKRAGLEKGERRGLKKGKRAGLRAGLREGKRAEAERLFLKLYTAKSGRSPADVRRRAGEATLEQLETWAASLLMVGRAEDVFDG
ncbi:MAG: hypothetical protein GY737_17785 [Desulfobacteraceae bacterium]|nr:hypothetical protein [Desulfobacteraceae bacterium]